MAKKTKDAITHPDPPVELTVFSCGLAKLQLKKIMGNSGEFVWLHEQLVKPSYDHLNFIYKNQNFSIIIDIQDKDGNSYTSSDFLKYQRYAVENYGVIPCKFPIITDDPYKTDTRSIRPKTNGWNLFHTETGEEIIPQELVSDEKKELSAFEIRNYGVRFMAIFLRSKGCKVTFTQDTMEVSPQLWIIEPNGHRSWVLVRCQLASEERKDFSKDIRSTMRDLFRSNGYYAELELISPNGNKEKLYRGDDARINFIKFEKVHTPYKSEKTEGGSILEENVYNMVMDSMSHAPIYKGSRVQIYAIPNHKEYILKTGRKWFKNPDKIKKRLVLIPIKYENKLEDNPRFGLPLYHIDKKSSELAKRGYATPKEVICFDNRNPSIMRYIRGQDVNELYSIFASHIIGSSDKDLRYKQTDIIYDIFKNYGYDAVIKALDFCKRGIHDIEENKIADGSPAYRFIDEKEFYIEYGGFMMNYLRRLGEFADLPQKTFDTAVQDILSAKGFVFDFLHPKNTFINFQTKEFLFIDVLFDDKYIERFKDKNPLEEFRNVLLGYNHNNDIQPKDLVFYPKDREYFEKFTKTITEKLNHSAPDNYKLKENY